jgi:hypothetical protein
MIREPPYYFPNIFHSGAVTGFLHRLDPYVPRPQRGPSVRAGLFRKDEFSYDPTSDSFRCPAGQHLHPYSSSLLRGLKKINYRNGQACRDCSIRSQCTGNQFRSVSRLENEAVLDRMQARIAQRPDILDQRRETVEHPFGTIKQWMNQGAFLMRGLEKVRAEFSLTALAYNLRRVLNIMELPKLIGCAPGLKATPEHPRLDRPRALSSITASDGSFTNRTASLRKLPQHFIAAEKQCFHTVCLISATPVRRPAPAALTDSCTWHRLAHLG